MRASSFLKSVWSIHAEDGDYFCVSTKSKMGEVWKDHFFTWPCGLKLKRFFEKYDLERYHFYFCATPFTEARRLKKFVRGSQLLWADLDEARPEQCKPKPQIAWESSPGRYAALWILNDFHAPDIIEEKNRGLTYKSEADVSGWDLTQVLRIPGTLNHKYKMSPKGKILWQRETSLSLDDIPDYIETSLDPKEILKKWRKKIPRPLLKTLLATRATQGKRSDVLWRIEVELVDLGMSESEILTLVRRSVWNKFKGRRDEEKQLRREIDKAIESRPEAQRALHEVAGLNDDEPENKGQHGRIVRMSDVEEELVDWLWHPYIPMGKVTIVEGDPDLGKSWFTLAIAAALSRGLRLPEQPHIMRGRTLLLSAEDGLGDTLKGRLRILGANHKRIYAHNLEHVDGLAKLDTLGLEELEDDCTSLGVKLLIVDPLVAYMGADVDLHKANETREMMTGLARLAARSGIAVVVVRHLRKGGADKSIYRGLGSIDITAAARSALMIGRDPDDSDGRIMCHIKGNLAAKGPPIEYFLRRSDKNQFEWGGVRDISIADVMKTDVQSGGGKSDAERAREFLNAALDDGDAPLERLKRDAEGKGIGVKILHAMIKDLGLKTYRKAKQIWCGNGPDNQ